MAGYYLKRGSKIHGPVDSVKLTELAREGKVKPTDEVSTSQEGPWRTAAGFSVLKEAFAASPETGQWFVNISGFAGDQIRGPLGTNRIKDLIDENKVNARTQVMHPIETRNEWVALRQTDLITHIEQRKEDNRERKQVAKLEKQQVAATKKKKTRTVQYQAGFVRGVCTCPQCGLEISKKMLFDGAEICCRQCGRNLTAPYQHRYLTREEEIEPWWVTLGGWLLFLLIFGGAIFGLYYLSTRQ